MTQTVTNTSAPGNPANQSSLDDTKNQTGVTNQNPNDVTEYGNDEDGNNVFFVVDEIFDKDKILDSTIYQQQAKLLEDPQLEHNEMYRKLVTRLSAFYVNCEQIRLCGLNKTQEEAIAKSGYNMHFRKQLHQSLRSKLL